MTIRRHFQTSAFVSCHILCILQDVNPRELAEEKLHSTHYGHKVFASRDLAFDFDFVLSLNLRCVGKLETVSLGVVTSETKALIGSIVRFAAGRQIGKNVHARSFRFAGR